jgi:hypothetical protein
MYTDDEKRLILETLAEFSDDVDKYPDLREVCKLAGMKAVGKPCSYWSIRRWKDETEELGELFGSALLQRAEDYMRKAHAVIEHIEEFWDAPYIDLRGNHYIMRKERLTAVNAAKLRVEHYRWSAAKMAPEVYGDYYHEIKKCEEAIKSMQKQITEMVSGRL